MPGASESSILLVALSNADANEWYGTCSPVESEFSGYDMAARANAFSSQNSLYIWASVNLRLTGDSVKVSDGFVLSGRSVQQMTTSQPLHVRKIYRLL